MPTPASPVPPVPRLIEGTRRVAPDEVVLRLDCGHERHARHHPPLTSLPWVLDDAACEARVGQAIECLRCGQRLMPDAARFVRSTAVFDEHTLPAGLRHAHSTKAGVWGRLVVEEGVLRLWFEPPLDEEVEARPGGSVAIPPQLRHEVRLCGPVRFRVEFLRVDG